MAHILITGGSGFIGTNLVEFYLLNGDRVINLDIAAPRNDAHIAHWRQADVLDLARLRTVVHESSPQIVFHLAARTDLQGDSDEDYLANTDGVFNLIQVLREVKGVECVVFASSMLVCRLGFQPPDEFTYAPSTAYGASKVQGEQIVRGEVGDAFPWVIVRPTSLWGPWFDVPYRNFFTAIRRGLYVHPRGKRIMRSYGFVLNNVFQLAKIAQLRGGALTGRAVYLADYQPIELKNWADTIQRHLGAHRVKEAPMWVFRTAARVGNILKIFGYKNPPMSSFRLNNMLTESIHDIRPLQAACGDVPYTMEQGVQITCNWIARK